MNISLNNTEALRAELTITLSPEDYKPVVTEELKKQARKASLPGFRPGKVPVSVVRRMVGLAVVVEEVNKILSKTLNDYIQDEKLNILGDPLPKDKYSEDDFDPYCKKELSFTYLLGLAPEFEVNLDIPKMPAKLQIDIDDEYIEKDLEQLKDRFGESTTPEEVAKGDIIYGRLSELNEEGEVIEEGFEKMVALNPQRITKEEIFEPFMGKEIDFATELDVFTLADTNEELGSLLFMEPDEVEELKGKKLSFSIRRITRVTMAEMNPTFFNKVLENEEGSEDWVEEEADFIAKFKEKIADELKDVPKYRYHRELRDAILEANPLELPDAFLQKWLKAANEKVSEEEIEKEYDGFAQNTRWSLIKEKFIDANPDLKVETEELEASILKALKQQMPFMDEAQEKQFMEHAIQNREIVNMHFTRLSEDKIFGHLEGEMEENLEVMNATDFFELLEKEREEEEKKKQAEAEATEVEAEEVVADNNE